MRTRIVDEKNSSGQTYRQIAAAVGMDVAAVYRAINRPDSVSFETFTAVAAYLGVERQEAVDIWTAESYARRERELREELAQYR